MKKLIIITCVMACILLYILEQILEVNYIMKTGSKWVFFFIIPLILDRFIDKNSVPKSFHKKGMFFGFLFGISSFLIILSAYFLLKDLVNFDAIIDELTTKSKITAANFIFIGIYITFGNSLLEEFFFRGFIFLNLRQLGNEKFAYLFSALLFSIYHISIFQTWFSIPITLLAMVGLFTIGLIFNWLNTKTNTIVNSWIVHILADSAIILIGLSLFKII